MKWEDIERVVIIILAVVKLLELILPLIDKLLSSLISLISTRIINRKDD